MHYTQLYDINNDMSAARDDPLCGITTRVAGA